VTIHLGGGVNSFDIEKKVSLRGWTL